MKSPRPRFQNLRAVGRYWLGGVVLAMAGVGTARLLAPRLGAREAALVALCGQLVALTGLLVIVLGIRRRLRNAGAHGA